MKKKVLREKYRDNDTEMYQVLRKNMVDLVEGKQKKGRKKKDD